MHKNLKSILIDEKRIIAKSKQLGEAITERYREDKEPPIFVALLKGSVPFLAELVKYVELDIELDFMDVSSYGGGTESTRDIRILKDLDRSIKGKKIIIVEDIVETVAQRK
jgi:hypoxanthine phosphoribosyltransferase